MTLSPIQGASREWSLLGLKPIARYGSNALIYSNKDYMSCLNLLALGNALSESTTMGWVCVCVCVCVWRAGGPIVSTLERRPARAKYFADAAARAAQHLGPGATLAVQSRRPQQQQAWKAAPGSAPCTQILIDAHIPTVPSIYLLFAGPNRT